MPDTLDDWLEEWRIHEGWQAKKAEVQRLVDEIERLRRLAAERAEEILRLQTENDGLADLLGDY